MRNAGPPWSTPSQDPYGYQPQPSGYQSQPSRSPWPEADAPPAASYGADDYRGDGYRADSYHDDGGSHGDGSHTTTTGDGRHARPARGRLARWATASGIVVALVGVTAAVGFLARSSSVAQSSPPTSSKQAVPAQTGASSAAAPTTPTAKTGSATTSTAGTVPAGLGSNWKLTFNAGFTGSKLDSSVWGTCYPWQSQSGCANFGNSDLEYQWYASSQDQVSNGALHIVAQKAPTAGHDSGGGPEEYSYRSGLVTTFPGYKFQYGYLQVVARIPDATGTWSALWLAAANEQWPPEIDILEHWGTDTKYFEYYHPSGAPRENSDQVLGNLSGSWHTYGVYWSQSKVVWYIDGHQVFETGRNVPQQPMYFLANVAIDVQVPSLDTSMDIKSVSVWQQAG